MRRFLVLFCAVFLPVLAGAQVALVAHTASNAATSTAINTTGATLIVVSCSYYSAAGAVTDSQANTWVQLTAYGRTTSPFPGYTRMSYSYGPITSATHTFTCGSGSQTFPGIAVEAFSGTIATAAVFDQQSGSLVNTPGSITPVGTGEVFVTAEAHAAASDVSDTASAGFTTTDWAHNGTSQIGIAYNVNAGSGALNPVWSGSSNAPSAMATFKSAAGLVVTPVISPGAGTYTTTQTPTVTSATGSATICYTLDGSAPTANGAGTCTHGTSIANGATVSIAVTETLKAIASKSGLADSAAASAAFVLQGSAPTFSPGAGLYSTTQTVTASQAQSLAQVCTTDGSTPTSNGSGTALNGTLYSAPISVSVSETLKCIGMASGWTDSAVGSAIYTMTAISLVAHAIAAGASAVPVTSPLDTTGATLIVAGCRDTTTLAGVSITASPSAGTWQSLTNYGGVAFAGYVRQFYAYAPTTNAAQTFTCTGTTFSAVITVTAWKGTQTSSDPLDGQSGSNSTAIPGSITPSQAGDLFITAFANGNSGTTTFAVDSGFFISDSFHDGSRVDGAMAYVVDPTTAAENPSWAGSNGAYRTTAMAAFKIATASSQGPFTTIIQ